MGIRIAGISKAQGNAAYESLGTTAAVAVLYVTTDGDDTNNDGRSWGKAFATINAAIAALGANGGVIEVGYGDFAPFTISSTTGTKFGITVRGRGIGKNLSYTDSTTTTGKHPTRIVNSGGAGTNAVTIVGATDTEDHWPGGIILEDFAVAGNSTSQDGINISNAPYVQLSRIVSEGNGRYGLYAISGWIFDLDTVRCVNNGTVGASLSGGAFFDSPVNHVNIRGTSYFSGNYGYGMKVNASVVNCFGTLFERNKANAAEQGNGVRLIIGPGMLNLFGCWFESNGTAYHVRNEVANARVLAQGCYFEGNGAVQYAMRAFSTSHLTVRNCRFSGHTQKSIDASGTVGAFELVSNYCGDTAYITIGSLPILPANAGTRVIVNPLPTALPLWGAVAPTSATDSTFVANTAYLVPVHVPNSATYTKVAFFQDVSSGNVDVGVYDTALNRLASSGSTAAPASGAATVSFTSSLALPPGDYYIAIAFDNATATVTGVVGNSSKAVGCQSKITSFPLPTTITTPAVSSNGPSVGLA